MNAVQSETPHVLSDGRQHRLALLQGDKRNPEERLALDVLKRTTTKRDPILLWEIWLR